MIAMRFTTLPSAQIARVVKGIVIMPSNCNPGGPFNFNPHVTALGRLSSQANNSMGYVRIWAKGETLEPGCFESWF